MNVKRGSMLQGLAIAGCLAGSPAYAAQDEGEIPEDALLEFLGGWESVDGELIDPVALADLEAEGRLADRDTRKAGDADGDDEDES